jgi:hypothetical protein
MGIEESKLSELHKDISYHAEKFRRGEISFEEYNHMTRELIASYHKRYTIEDIHKDSEPHGILGVILSAIRKLF